MATFSQFASDLDASTKKLLERGERLTELLKQPQYSPFSMQEEVVSLFAGVRGFLDKIPTEKIAEFEKLYLETLHSEHKDFMDKLARQGSLLPEDETYLTNLLESFVAAFKGE